MTHDIPHSAGSTDHTDAVDILLAEEITAVREVPDELVDRGADTRRGTLTALLGPRAGVTFSLHDDCTNIGRLARCEVTLSEVGVSRVHARIGRVGRNYFIEDLQSTNGTYVNGERIQRPTLLEEGARVVIGTATVLRFALLDPMTVAASRRIYEATVRDPLTGVYNRRYLDERLAEEFASAVRTDTPLCVMVLDIDHFKAVNDNHGHATGDAVLCAVAETIRSAVRGDDLVARVGGEEFVLVARHIDPQASLALAERLRMAVASQWVAIGSQRVSVTVSVGVAHSDSDMPLSRPEAMLKAADAALYLAKESGRDRVCVAGSAKPTQVQPATGQETRDRRRLLDRAHTTVDLQKGQTR